MANLEQNQPENSVWCAWNHLFLSVNEYKLQKTDKRFGTHWFIDLHINCYGKLPKLFCERFYETKML